ncbi:CHAT domain-containing protein [Catellatospora sp. NPDC049111]|uniref:CHAT domain-containing protein n=1 Tax=Catellatospora sp. NPDC049111 TaxID=3155271 RepID=UPI0033D3C0C6
MAAMQVVATLVTVETQADARSVLSACHQVEASGGLLRDQAVLVKLNKARALAMMAVFDRQFHRLRDALDLLSPLIGSEGTHLVFQAAAARDLAVAMNHAAEQTHDDYGYRQAIELMRVAAARAPGFDATADYHDSLADHHAFLARRAKDRGDPAAEQRCLDEAFRERLISIRALPVDAAGSRRADYLCKLGLAHLQRAERTAAEDHEFEGEGSAAARHLDAAMAAFAKGRRQRIRRGDPVRRRLDLSEASGHQLSGLLTGSTDELTRARRLAKRVIGDPFLASPAHQLLAQLEQQLGGRDAAKHYRAAAEANESFAATSTLDLLDEWCAWALEHGSVPQRAEALQRRALETARQTLRRTIREERELVLARSQGVAAAAGYWLARAGNPAAAAITMDFSRGITLSRLTGWVDPTLTEEASLRGHGPMIARYQAALARVAVLYRAQYSGPLRSAPATPGKLGELHEAWIEASRIREDLARVVSAVDPLGPPSITTLMRAAADAPIVYLAGAEDGGLAVIVSCDAPPFAFFLPQLTANKVIIWLTAVTSLGGLKSGPRARRLQQVFTDMCEALRDLPEQLHGHKAITLVPVGGLSLLPITAALTEAGLRAACRTATTGRSLLPRASTPGGALRVLVVDMPTAVNSERLRLTAEQSAYLAGDTGWRLPECTISEAVQALPTADVSYLVCHGRADTAEPLNSALHLRDGVLTVRDLLSQGTRLRGLVVLSACETHLAGSVVADEAVGFPAALVQAGAVGVVAALWKVEELATALLVRRFHDRYLQTRHGPRALAESQYWLRTTTQAEFRAMHPDLYQLEPPAATVEAARIRAQRHRTELPYTHPYYWAGFAYTGR